MMLIEALSVFPEMFEPVLSTSILGRARQAGIFDFRAYDLRDWTHDRHRTVDDEPYGGGQGMLMKAPPIYEAVRSIASSGPRPHVVFFTPCGAPFTQAAAERLAMQERLLFVCGRYEGIDERVYTLADHVISLGDYVLTSGELASMVVIDAAVRKLPGVLGAAEGPVDESFTSGLLEYPQYSRPEEWHGKKVPEVLMSGHHANIEKWRREQSIYRTAKRRPDLLKKADLTNKEWNYVRQLRKQWKEEEEQIK